MTLPPLTIGPLLLPAGLWLSLLALAAASLVWRRQLVRAVPEANQDDTPLMLAGLGMLGARIGFVALYWREYLNEPWSLIRITDGGWWWPGGVAAIVLGAIALGWRRVVLRRPLLLATTAAAGIGGLAAFVAGTWSPASESRIPELQVQNFSGHAQPLHDGRPTLINLWATWCPPCRREMPALVAGAQRYPDIRFVLVNQGEDQATVGAAASQWRIPEALLALDQDSAVSTALGVRGFPTTLIVAADGRILARHTGEVSGASLAALVEAIETDSGEAVNGGLQDHGNSGAASSKPSAITLSSIAASSTSVTVDSATSRSHGSPSSFSTQFLVTAMDRQARR
jgi:thiol-disulfide isomerase/thioredoxin